MGANDFTHPTSNPSQWFNSSATPPAFPTLQYYMLPLGIWQFWAMFAPDPIRDTLTVEAEVIDARGLRHLFAFTRVGDLNRWDSIPKFRHSKYTVNLSIDEF